MKHLNGKNYYSQKEINEKLRSIYIDDMNDVAHYCEWVGLYEGQAEPVIQGICRGIVMASRAIKNTNESYLTFIQMRSLLRDQMHGNFEFDMRTYLDGCQEIDYGWTYFLHNEGITICVSELRELEQSKTNR